jgi:hypothetical protein
VLPLLQEGEDVHARNVSLAEKKTTPPKRFTGATLVQAMTGIAKYVSDPTIPLTERRHRAVLRMPPMFSIKTRHRASTCGGRP